MRQEQMSMLRNLSFMNQARACCLSISAFAWMGAVAAGCSDHRDTADDDEGSEHTSKEDAGPDDAAHDAGGKAPTDTKTPTGQGTKSDSMNGGATGEGERSLPGS